MIRTSIDVPSMIHARQSRRDGRCGGPKLPAVIDGCEVTRGGQCWAEREVLRLVVAAGLPRPQTQQVLSRTRDRLIRVDLRFPARPPW